MFNESVKRPARIWTLIAACLLAASVAACLGQEALGQPAGGQRSGLIFVSAEKSNAVFVIDPKTYKVTRTIKTSKWPRDMHFSADRKRLYVACGDADTADVIFVFSPRPAHVVAEISLTTPRAERTSAEIAAIASRIAGTT